MSLCAASRLCLRPGEAVEREPVHKQAIEWLRYDARRDFFVNALQFINWEGVPGDILEFGVSVGKSLALFSRLQQENLEHWRYTEPVCCERRIAGFDTFTGLPPDETPHPRFGPGYFATNYLVGHPTLAYHEPITPQAIRLMFEVCKLPEPELEVGLFDETLPQVIPAKYKQAAIVHIDSDLYASARTVLRAVEPILQSGSLILFDDWFMYRGAPDKGEQRAFTEFLAEHPHWQAIPYQTYSVFCNSFIMHRRSS